MACIQRRGLGLWATLGVKLFTNPKAIAYKGPPGAHSQLAYLGHRKRATNDSTPSMADT